MLKLETIGLRKILSLSLLVTLIASCSPSAVSITSTPVPVPSDTPLQAQPTDKPTAIQPTVIDSPSATPTSSWTDTPQPTLTPLPTAALRPITEAIPGEILFSIYPDGDISIMDADGDNWLMLIDQPIDFSINIDRHASWLPDGSGISYTVDDFEFAEIWWMDLSGGDPQLLIGEAATNSAHAWSSDGEMLAYVSPQNQIEIYRLADQTVMPLTDGGFRAESDPDWSPDGAAIAFTATNDGNVDIYTIQLDGTDLTRITSHPNADQTPDWSPVGANIAFSSTRDGDHISDLFVIDLSLGTEEEGNTPLQLTFDENLNVDPDWSPDGNYIVYASHTFGASHATLFIIDAQGQRQNQLTEENTYHSPKWKPDVLPPTPIEPALSIEVPAGIPPTINGRLSEAEWARARVVPLMGGGQLHLLHADGYLFLGIRAVEHGIGSLCHYQNGRISVMHASAGLGTFIYQQGEDAWESVTQFFGCCMDLPETMRGAAQLEDQGWVANLVQKGDPNEMEYQIALGEGDLILAVTYILVDSPAFVWWPEDLDDDCGKMELVGEVPDITSLHFAPETWVKIIPVE